LIALAVLFVAGKCVQLYRHRQEPFPSALAAMAPADNSKDGVTVRILDGGHILFMPAVCSKPVVGAAYLPGALVHHHAYAPLCRDIAHRSGLPVVLMRMTLRIAPCSKGVITKALQAVSEAICVRSWVIGGHSLGGQMAGSLASSGIAGVALAGVFLHASYYTSSTPLSDENLSVLQLLGECDRVISPEGLAGAAKNLPPGRTITSVIAGGNHAGFGHYGPQRYPRPDGDRSISLEEQQRQVSEQTSHWLLTVVQSQTAHLTAKAASPEKLWPAMPTTPPISPLRRQSSIEVLTSGLSVLQHDSSPLAGTRGSPARARARWDAASLARAKQDE
jgi:hypothetical protein